MWDDDPAHARRRAALAARLRSSREVTDERVLDAFTQVPRHVFVPAGQIDRAYEDRALPLAEGQTISQPTMIALMLEALDCRSTDRALEIGAGCGYASALLSRLVEHVDAVELRPTLAQMGVANLAMAGVTNVTIHVGNGQHGLPSRGPFQRILVSAGAPSVSARLLAQLAPKGRIAIPVDEGGGQVLKVGERSEAGTVTWRRGVRCLFVPLVTNP